MCENDTPPEVLIHDELEPCPYLEGRTARLPMRFPFRPLSRAELDVRLAGGDRRQGTMLYRTDCPRCQACEPIRIDVTGFTPNRTQRRVLKRGDEAFRVEIGEPTVDDQRVRLYNLHKQGRRLDSGEGAIDAATYQAFLVDSCCETMELRYWLGDRLAAVAVADRGLQSLSAVYCYFDPAHARLSPGTYSVLKQIEFCRRHALKHLYLGLYIAEAPTMAYKGNFRPHQRLIDGRWRTFHRKATAVAQG